MEQDWPNLKKYRAANEQIVLSQNFPEVVFMGNSITEGWVNHNPSFFEEHKFAGRGIGGQTTPQMLTRFTPDVVDLQPKAVVILAGTNDIAGNTGFSSVKMIKDNLRMMTEIAQQNNIRVILSSILPVFDYPWRPALKPVDKIAEINSWMMDLAENNDLVYVDYFNSMVDEKGGLKKEFSGDGVHPNAKGYSIMEPLVLKAVSKALDN